MELEKQMTDDHTMRAECAVQFAEIRKDIARVRDGHASQATALEKLTVAVQSTSAVNQRNHDEATRMISGFQGTLVDMFSRQSERLALIEQSDRAAHHRLDGLNKMLWGVVILMISIAGGVIINALTNGIG